MAAEFAEIVICWGNLKLSRTLRNFSGIEVFYNVEAWTRFEAKSKF